MKISKIGTEKHYEDYLNRKIELSNQIVIILVTCVALPFIAISYLFFKPLILIPIVGIFTCVFTIGFNYLKWHVMARVVVCLLPITLSNLFGGYLANSGEPLLPSMTMLSLSFSLVMFLVIDIREKTFLYSMSGIMLVMILSMNWFNESFEIPLDTEIIKTGFLSYVVMFISFFTGTGCIILVISYSKKTEDQAVALLAESHKNQQLMTVKEHELTKNIHALEQSQKEEELRQWASDGIASAITIMREAENSSDTFYDQIISFTVKRIGATQGSLFFLKENDQAKKYLEQVATYAYDRKKFIKNTIELGEGLVGQVFLEKEYELLNEIPHDYLNINSGLGDAKPRNVLIMPLVSNDDAVGILELASFHEIEPYQIEFLQSLSENIASAYHNTQINIQTKVLLEKAQTQAEELRSQEEEMRQNQEELQAVQEELTRQKRELEYVVKELKEKLSKYEIEEC